MEFITVTMPDGVIKHILKTSVNGYDSFDDGSIEIYFVGGGSLYLEPAQASTFLEDFLA